MSIYSNAAGQYESGNTATADILIGHSFGTEIGKGSVNHNLAQMITIYGENEGTGMRPILVDRMLANAFPGRDADVDHVVEGPITNGRGEGVGTWGVLEEARDFMQQHDLQKALMFGHAHHIGRILAQSEKLGINAVAPDGLPNTFDKASDQWWTRSRMLWLVREIPANFALQRKGQL